MREGGQEMERRGEKKRRMEHKVERLKEERRRESERTQRGQERGWRRYEGKREVVAEDKEDGFLPSSPSNMEL